MFCCRFGRMLTWCGTPPNIVIFPVYASLGRNSGGPISPCTMSEYTYPVVIEWWLQRFILSSILNQIRTWISNSNICFMKDVINHLCCLKGSWQKLIQIFIIDLIESLSLKLMQYRLYVIDVDHRIHVRLLNERIFHCPRSPELSLDDHQVTRIFKYSYIWIYTWYNVKIFTYWWYAYEFVISNPYINENHLY